MELEVLYEGAVVESRALGEAAIHVGRSPVNELVLRDPGVSGHHAVIWREEGRVRVRDLGSSNGTFVNGERLSGSAELSDGDKVRFGPTVTVRLVGRALVGPALGPLRLELVGTSVAWGITRDRFSVPGDEDVDLLLFPDGEVWLAVNGEEVRALDLDDPFEVGDKTYVLRRDTNPTPATQRPAVVPYDYSLTVRLADARAVIEDRGSGRRAEVTTENRVALLYALGQRWLEDGEGEGRGWLDDEDAAVAVWGRERHQHGANNYNVLVHRIRRELQGAELDRWCVEKRAGRTRIRVTRVDLGQA